MKVRCLARLSSFAVAALAYPAVLGAQEDVYRKLPSVEKQFLPIELKCSDLNSGKTQLLSMNPHGDQALMTYSHEPQPYIEYIIKSLGEREFAQAFFVRLDEIASLDERSQKTANKIHSQALGLETDICNADKDYQRRYQEMLDQNAAKVGFRR
jgi:hypothetical protein